MNRSETIVKLAVALAKFNAEVTSISKDAKNPFFKSDYVTLDKLILATRDILQKNGLSVLQMPLSKETGEIGIQTILLHESGEYIESEPLFMKPVKNDPQQAGSLITYLRRYSYQAILNLNTGEDDDANLTTHGSSKPKERLSDKQLSRLFAIGKSKGINQATITAQCVKEFGVSDISQMTKEQYDNICSRLEKVQK